MKAVTRQISIPAGKRIICISDIHGSLDLFKQLLDKSGFTDDDILILLGDLYTKGKQKHDTLKFIIELSKNPNVYVLRGNCDWIEEYVTDDEKAWLDGLPHLIESQEYIFVHGGIPVSGTEVHGAIKPGVETSEAMAYMKNDAFLEQGLTFDKYVITGHWPTINYMHKVPCCNPIIDRESRIIAIDGGIVVRKDGQLNALIIEDGSFSFESADCLPQIKIDKAQPASGGTLSITWKDRFIEILEESEEFSLCKHLLTGRSILIANADIFRDWDGDLCANGTDYHLPVEAGDIVSVVGRYSDRILAKKDGTVGWVLT